MREQMAVYRNTVYFHIEMHITVKKHAVFSQLRGKAVGFDGGRENISVKEKYK